MTPEPCVQWRGAVALYALDALDAREATSLVAHLDGCDDCAAALAELRDVSDSLGHLDEASLGPTAMVPAVLASNVLGELRHGAARSRRRRHAVVTAIAAALVVLASVATWAGISSPPGVPTKTLELRGADGATATALLVARPWGTEITLTEHGLPSGHNYVVSLRASTASWWSAGTFKADRRASVTTQLSCAVPMLEVAGIEIEAIDGTTVLKGGSFGAAHWQSGASSS